MKNTFDKITHVFPETFSKLPYQNGFDNLKHIMDNLGLNTIQVETLVTYTQLQHIYHLKMVLLITPDAGTYKIMLFNQHERYSCFELTTQQDNTIYLDGIIGTARHKCFSSQDQLPSRTYGYIYMTLCIDLCRKLKFKELSLHDASAKECAGEDTYVSLSMYKLFTVGHTYYEQFGFKSVDPTIESIKDKFIALLSQPIIGILSDPRGANMTQLIHKYQTHTKQYLKDHSNLPYDKKHLIELTDIYINYIYDHRSHSGFEICRYLFENDCFYCLITEICMMGNFFTPEMTKIYYELSSSTNFVVKELN